MATPTNWCAFKLMPLEPHFRKPIEAQWSFQVVDMDRRLVAFKDLSIGKITSWKWDFGDGETSTEPNPIHTYKKPDIMSSCFGSKDRRANRAGPRSGTWQ